MKKYLHPLIIILFFFGCSPSLKNLRYYKLDIIDYYESGKFDDDVRNVIREAISDLKSTRVQDSTAVIFDVDETALNNYAHIKQYDFGYNADVWNTWIQQERAPAISAVKDFYNFIISKKIHVIFLTGRSEDQYKATYDNLINAGYTKFDTLIVRPEKDKDDPAANYKNIERIVLASLGYKIIASVGDQESDFTGNNTGLKIKIPNYLYIIE